MNKVKSAMTASGPCVRQMQQELVSGMSHYSEACYSTVNTEPCQ